MRRLLLLLAVVVLVAVMVGANAAPLSAQPDVVPEPDLRCLDDSIDLPDRHGCLHAAGGFEQAGPFVPFPIKDVCRIYPDFSSECPDPDFDEEID